MEDLTLMSLSVFENDTLVPFQVRTFYSDGSLELLIDDDLRSDFRDFGKWKHIDFMPSLGRIAQMRHLHTLVNHNNCEIALERCRCFTFEKLSVSSRQFAQIGLVLTDHDTFQVLVIIQWLRHKYFEFFLNIWQDSVW